MIPVLSKKTGLSKHVTAYLERLQRIDTFTGEVSCSEGERLLQSTDNSIYQVMPQAVIYPKSTEDVSSIMSVMNEPEFDAVHVTARGGGTGTNGQALNNGVIVDVSKYMNKIKEIDLENGYAVVEAGVVLDQLNKELGKHDYFFAPMVSTSSRATIGGMCATDGSGIGSLLYGKTSNHLDTVKLVFADGTVFDSFSRSSDDIEKLGNQKASTVLKTVEMIVKSKREKVLEKFPKLNRFMTGYNLKHSLEDNGNINLNYIVSGSEGTLAIFTEIKVKILKKPKFEKVVVCKFKSFEQGLRSARYLVKHLPTGVETIDGNIVALARNNNIWGSVSKFFAAPGDEDVECVNYVQFTEYSEQAVDEKVGGLLRDLESRVGRPGELNSFEVVSSPEDLDAVWSMRKKGVGLLGSKPGEKRPQAFVEDTAVDPEVLADFIMEFRAILDGYGLEYGMFGHIDAGCLHVRPALDLKQEHDKNLIRTITDQIKELTIKYKGVLWGEHGKGFRGEYLPDFFGPELYEDLRRIKTAFDPKNKMNPGKFCTPLETTSTVTAIDDVVLRGDYDRQIPAHVKKDYDVVMNCNGNGTCFNFNPDDVMCPSYRYSRSRLQSPKGRASLIREWLRQLTLSGYDPTIGVDKPYKTASKELSTAPSKTSGLEFSKEPSTETSRESNYDFSHEVYASMKECLSCKACSGQCPIKVDIPEVKAKFLEQYHTRYSRPRKDYLIKATESLHSKLASVPFIYNFPLKVPGVSWLLEKSTGMIDPPLLSVPSLARRLKEMSIGSIEDVFKLTRDRAEKSVVVVQDPLTSFYEAELVCEHLQLFKKLGFDVYVMPYGQNGKALHVKGFLQDFKKTALQQNKRLQEISKTGANLVTIEPAIALTYREEYPRYLGQENVDYRVMMPQEFLAEALSNDDAARSLEISKGLGAKDEASFKASLFGHCGEKTATPQYAALWKGVFSKFGVELTIEKTGCCGMAGAYGHEAEHFESSKGIYEMHWQDKLKAVQKTDRVVLATGASCRSQVKRLEKKKVLHPVEFLNSLV